MVNSFSVHSDNRKKDISKGTEDGFYGATLTAEAEYTINFSEHQNKFCVSIYYNGSKRFLLVDKVKIYQFKGKDSTKIHIYYVWVIFKKILQLVIWKNPTIFICVWFSTDFGCIDADMILDIHKYLMKKYDIKQYLDLFKKCLLSYQVVVG